MKEPHNNSIKPQIITANNANDITIKPQGIDPIPLTGV